MSLNIREVLMYRNRNIERHIFLGVSCGYVCRVGYNVHTIIYE